MSEQILNFNLPDDPNETPQCYFSKLPSEFGGEWLTERVSNLGWPAENQPLKWARVLGEPPQLWRARSWVKRNVDITQVRWCSETSQTISDLSQTLLGLPPHQGWEGHMREGLRKIEEISKYAKKSGNLPGTLLILARSDGSFLVDGYHRVTWFSLMLRMPIENFTVSSEVSAYVAETS